MQTVEGEMLSESNLLQTLQQHGLALSADDLHTLRNFIKPATNEAAAAGQQQSSALGSEANGLLHLKNDHHVEMTSKPAAASVSLTLSNGQVIQLTDPLDTQPKVQFATQFEPQAHVFATATVATRVPDEELVPSNHGFQNEFLEDLARSQIVSDSKKVKAKSPAVKNAVKKKAEPKKKKPPVKIATISTTETVHTPNSIQSQQVASTPGNTAGVPRVQTIKLSPQNQQVGKKNIGTELLLID